MPIALALVGLALLYLGGEGLIRGSFALPTRLGVSSLATGLTVVAFGTSAPELVVSVDAALSGANDVSLGNAVGSNIARSCGSISAPCWASRALWAFFS